MVRGARARLSHAVATANRLGPAVGRRFRSGLHHEWLAARLGVALGTSFGICFVTGLMSHLAQHPALGLRWPTTPSWLFAFTQGVHVATGLAAVPLLLAKLYVVYPQLFTWPPARDLAHAVERGALLLLVGGSVFQLATGVMNIERWYAWAFFFTTAHYWTAWITIGALVVHIGSRLAVTRMALREKTPQAEPTGSLTRRGLLLTAGLGALALVTTTAGQSLAPLRRLSVLAPRRGDVGPQGLPVNKTARGAGVLDAIADPGWRLEVSGPTPLRLSLADLRAMPQRTVRLPIACVEGWNAWVTWTGVPVKALLHAAGWRDHGDVVVESLQARSRYRRVLLPRSHAQHPDSLVALAIHGEALVADHGAPARLIAPTLPGVMQTKWLASIRPREP